MSTVAAQAAFRTQAEVDAYNKGIEAVLEIARRSAAAIAATSRRRVHEDFAIAALGELGEAGMGLLIVAAEPSRGGHG